MLFTPEEAQAVSARVKTAFRVLGDANERARYDRALDEQTANGSIAVPDGVAPTLNETTTLAEDVPALVTVAEGDWRRPAGQTSSVWRAFWPPQPGATGRPFNGCARPAT